MSNRSGRPAKGSEKNSKENIIESTIAIIKEQGSEAVTVRNVCAKAELSIGTFYHYFRDKDDLLMYFLSEIQFENCELTVDLSKISDRICELYMKLINRYMELGLDFMKSFYSTGNRSLSAYMGEIDGSFAPGTVMARSEKELTDAKNKGYIKKNADIHMLCTDICTIVKGCVFEWCLNDGKTDIEPALYRIVDNYLSVFHNT